MSTVTLSAIGQTETLIIATYYEYVGGRHLGKHPRAEALQGAQTNGRVSPSYLEVE